MKASDLFTKEDLARIKFILKMFNGKVIKINDECVDMTT